MEKKEIYVNEVSKAWGLPFCDIAEVGDFLFISGMCATDWVEGDDIYDTVEVETKNILDSLSDILEANGSDMEHVVKATVVLRNWEDKDAMNAEYEKHWAPGKYPARIAYGNVAINGESKVEMDFIAVKK